MRNRNTTAFTFLAWTAFITALLAMFIGIYTLKEPLSVKGYYAVGTLYLTMSAFVLQKTIRDNEEQKQNERRFEKTEEE
ncbi:hypothetical protein FZC66_08075 [Priestia megaterium]|nr:hypothetical protein FZC66_08075 [Priestia megaterium]